MYEDISDMYLSSVLREIDIFTLYHMVSDRAVIYQDSRIRAVRKLSHHYFHLWCIFVNAMF